MSTEFTNVDSQEAMDKFVWLVNGFHDALLREVGVVARGYVAPSGGMFGDVAPSDIRMIIHSQLAEAPLIEIIAEDLQKLRWESGWDMDPAGGIVTGTEVTLLFGLHPESFMVSAKSMKYRILGRDFLGQRLYAAERIVEDA